MKTYLAKTGEIQREYLLFDASEAPVGRLAVRIANALRGKDIAIIANGILVPEAIEAGKQLAEEGIDAMIINMATIKPLDEALVLEAAKKCGKIITVEEHNIIGGLGEAVCSLLSEKLPTPVRRIGVNDVFGHSGPAAALLKQFGLSAENIVAQTKNMLGK